MDGDASTQHFRKKFEKLVKKTDKVIFICHVGNRTRAIANHLSEREGYKGIINVTRGIDSWIKDGNPVVKASMPKDCWLCNAPVRRGSGR